jgi:hypothetical protein
MPETPEARKERKRLYNEQYYKVHRERLRLYNQEYYQATREQQLLTNQQYREAHREDLRLYAAQYRAREGHREKLRLYAKQYYRANREQVHLSAKQFRHAHREKIKAEKRAYAEANREKIRLKKRAYAQSHRAQCNVANQRRKAQKQGVTRNTLSTAQWQEIKEAFGHRCAYCGRKMARLTQDHITPLSQHGDHHVHNIVPACKSCNSRKYTGPPPTPVQPLLLTLAPEQKKKKAS